MNGIIILVCGLLLRPARKKAPEWVSAFLLGIAVIWLICPCFFARALSLIPDSGSGIPIGIYGYFWIFGMIALALYTAVGYWRLRRKADTAVLYKDNVFQSENVSSPFVLGIIKPRIYLPFKRNGGDLEHVIAHEQTRIFRKEHWWNGEAGKKDRIKSVMNHKKPVFWIIILAVIVCVVAAACFFTNPVSKNTVVMGADYKIEKVLYAVTVGDEISTGPPLQYCVTADYHLYSQQTESDGWNYLGALTPYGLTNDELNQYMPVDVVRKDLKVRQITDAYRLKAENDNFYLVFQTKDGKTYLAYGWEDAGERGQAELDDTRLRRLYLLKSRFQPGCVNIDFFQRSLENTVRNKVHCFASFESDKIPGYHIEEFKSGNSKDHSEMTDLGFAVFQTNGEGYRLIDCNVYENAALVENGIFSCPDPAVADINGEIRKDNTFDVLLILNEDADKVERVYRQDGKEDQVEADTCINAPYMSLWPREYPGAAASVFQYVYDEGGNTLSSDRVIPRNPADRED